MEENKARLELKHVCKLCNKGYPSGKSLGGHMRSHVLSNLHAAAQKVKPDAQEASTFYGGESEGKRESRVGNGGGGGGENCGYGLRENPRKTWRAVDSSFTVENERVCKQCGKGFQSLKALCGHMSSHSQKERKFMKHKYDDDDSWRSEEEEADKDSAMESLSDNVVEGETVRPKRTKGTRYKNLSANPLSLANGWSSNSEIEQEQEDVALCLMMLSRDSCLRGGGGRRGSSSDGDLGVNFTSESSGNNSVILEGGSSSARVRISKRKDPNPESNGNQPIKTKQSGNKNPKSVKMDKSDSGYFENGAKELESDDTVDGFIRNHEFKKPKVDYGSKLEAFDAGWLNGSITVDENYEINASQLRSRTTEDFDCPKVYENSCNKILQDYDNLESRKNDQKGSKCEPFVLNNGFKIHQSIGGDTGLRRQHGQNSTNDSSFSQSDGKQFAAKNMISGNIGKRNGSKKTKGHKCPFCPKVFPSGQALGGHKRSHLHGRSASQDKANSAPEKPRENGCLLDLNLPAPMEE
ncbi:hypothetical protein Nepgr_003622 [Nepenthes gracilis]|uniref:C2H2-type domain-containing protein n=1 Tax=Nepenthes gracilis TaxID=150966 RepID=A0AAD3XDW5_NEPGR|nr:hypothetical protein Nepgr_003622 [Nepenthes gracilis]